MSDSGERLEFLVKEIERFLLPRGFNIETRKRVYNDEGIQIAELDIVITGNIDSERINMLIECRDRPSEGPAPNSWVEQLVGRRMRFNFTKVVAVSTTGFAGGVKDFAETFDIELRSLDDITSEIVAGWFRAIVVTRHAIPLRIQVFPKGTNLQGEIQSQLSAVLAKSDIKTAIFIPTDAKDTKAVSILDIWKDVINRNPKLFDGLEFNGASRELSILVMFDKLDSNKYQLFDGFESADKSDQRPVLINFRDHDTKYHVQASHMLIPITGILFDAKFRITTDSKLASRVYQYSGLEKEPTALTVHFTFEDDNDGEEVMFIVSRRAPGSWPSIDQ